MLPPAVGHGACCDLEGTLISFSAVHLGGFNVRTPEGTDGLTAGDWTHSQAASLGMSLASTRPTSSAHMEAAVYMKVFMVSDWNTKMG